MKKSVLLACFIASTAYCQVGINTNSPTKELDVNGELRIRNIPNSSDDRLDYILLADDSGNVVKTSNKKPAYYYAREIGSTLPINGNASGGAFTELSYSSNVINDGISVSGKTYTIQNAGVYSVNVNYTPSIADTWRTGLNEFYIDILLNGAIVASTSFVFNSAAGEIWAPIISLPYVGEFASGSQIKIRAWHVSDGINTKSINGSRSNLSIVQIR